MNTAKHNCLSGHEFIVYLDGSATEPSKAQIEKHLNLCNSCFEAFIALFNDFLDNAAPEDWTGTTTGEQAFA